MPPHQLSSIRSFLRPACVRHSHPAHSTKHLFNLPRSRFQSTSPPTDKTRARIDRILDRLPRFLHPYTNGLRHAPVSHITSFLILHELTAIIPLLGLATLFHYTNWLPQAWVEGRWVSEGTERFGRYFGRKGWFGFEREERDPTGEAIQADVTADGALQTEEQREAAIEKRWHAGGKGSKILVEVATAYAITKVLLPLRIVASVWGTPWFAKAVIQRFKGLFGSKSTVGKAAEAVKRGP
jgi:hypothetical protein